MRGAFGRAYRTGLSPGAQPWRREVGQLGGPCGRCAQSLQGPARLHVLFRLVGPVRTPGRHGQMHWAVGRDRGPFPRGAAQSSSRQSVGRCLRLHGAPGWTNDNGELLWLSACCRPSLCCCRGACGYPRDLPRQRHGANSGIPQGGRRVSGRRVSSRRGQAGIGLSPSGRPESCLPLTSHSD